MAFLDNEGVSFLWQKIKTKFGAMVYYGVCSTASDSASKIVSIDDDFSLVEGAMIVVKFTNANSIASPTLNVNGTGAKPIYRYGTTAVSTGTTSTGWIAGAVQLFIYDGTGWVRDYWSNTTYSNASLGSGYATCPRLHNHKVANQGGGSRNLRTCTINLSFILPSGKILLL